MCSERTAAALALRRLVGGADFGDGDTFILAAMDAMPPGVALDREVLLLVLRRNGMALMYLSEEQRSDRELVLEAVRQCGEALRWASPALRSDAGVVLEALRQCYDALEWGDACLRGDKDFMRQAVALHGDCLYWVDSSLALDTDLALAAVRQRGQALRWVFDETPRYIDVALEAVRQNASALQWVSPRARRHRPIVLEAVRRDGCALYWAEAAHRADRALALLAVQRTWRAISFVDPSLQRDRELIEAAVGQWPESSVAEESSVAGSLSGVKTNLLVKRPSGSSIMIESVAGRCVKELKELLQSHVDAPPQRMRLVMDGEVRPMRDYEVPMPTALCGAAASSAVVVPGVSGVPGGVVDYLHRHPPGVTLLLLPKASS